MAALLALGAWLRFTGIDFLLPHHPEPDGGVIVFQLDAHEGRIVDAERHEYWGFYPHLLSQAARAWPTGGVATPASSASPAAAGASGTSASPDASAPLSAHLERARASQSRARRTVALSSLIVVPATFWLARRFLSRPWSAVAAALMATSFLHVWFAQQSRPHAVATGLDVLVVLAALWMHARPSIATWALGPLAFGLAVACLQSGVATGIALIVAVASVRERPARLWAALGVGAVAGAAFALSLYPASADPESANAPLVAWDSKYGMLLLKGHKLIIGLFDGQGLAIVLRALWEYEPVLLALAAVAIGFTLVRRWNHLPLWNPAHADRVEQLRIVLAFALAYFVVIALYARSYQRFVLPLLPFLAVLAAWTLSLFARRLRVSSSLGALALAAPVLAFEGFATWRLVELRARPDTLSQAADWIRANVEPTRSLVLLPGIDVPLATTDASRAKDAASFDVRGYPWRLWCAERGEARLPEPHHALALMPMGGKDMQRIRQDSAQYALALDADYAVVEVYEQYWRSRLLKNVYDGIVLRGTAVARFSPDGERANAGLPLSYQDDQMPEHVHWFARVLRAQSTGPVVEIYRLR